jgi:hypothetical protein
MCALRADSGRVLGKAVTARKAGQRIERPYIGQCQIAGSEHVICWWLSILRPRLHVHLNAVPCVNADPAELATHSNPRKSRRVTNAADFTS